MAASANRRKGDGDAGTWLPANKALRCDYVARLVALKRPYGASVTRAEHAAIALRARASAYPAPAARVSSTCQPTERRCHRPQGHDNAAAIAETGCSPTANEIPTPGLAPLRRGTPDYAANPRLDRDNDGLACE